MLFGWTVRSVNMVNKNVKQKKVGYITVEKIQIFHLYVRCPSPSYGFQHFWLSSNYTHTYKRCMMRWVQTIRIQSIGEQFLYSFQFTVDRCWPDSPFKIHFGQTLWNWWRCMLTTAAWFVVMHRNSIMRSTKAKNQKHLWYEDESEVSRRLDAICLRTGFQLTLINMSLNIWYEIYNYKWINKYES